MIQYAPYIADTIPAFTDDGIIIPFEHNPAVNIDNITGYSLWIKELNSYSIQQLTCSKTNSTNPLVFGIGGISLELGNYYKFQLAYIDNEGTGPYSTVAIGRYIGEAPTLELIGLDNTKFYGICEGRMTHDIENLYSYRFRLLSSDNTIVQDTGEQLYDNLRQLPQIFEPEYDIENGYEIEYSITTINGY